MSDTDGKAELLWPEKEIESLRQRVKELEEEAERAGAVVLNINAEKLRLEKELAALKQLHGKPVAWLWEHIRNETGECIDRGLSFNRVAPTNDTFLDGSTSTAVAPLAYTSAPTIPEGWLQRGDANDLRRN